MGRPRRRHRYAWSGTSASLTFSPLDVSLPTSRHASRFMRPSGRQRTKSGYLSSTITATGHSLLSTVKLSESLQAMHCHATSLLSRRSRITTVSYSTWTTSITLSQKRSSLSRYSAPWRGIRKPEILQTTSLAVGSANTVFQPSQSSNPNRSNQR